MTAGLVAEELELAITNGPCLSISIYDVERVAEAYCRCHIERLLQSMGVKKNQRLIALRFQLIA